MMSVRYIIGDFLVGTVRDTFLRYVVERGSELTASSRIGGMTAISYQLINIFKVILFNIGQCNINSPFASVIVLGIPRTQS